MKLKLLICVEELERNGVMIAFREFLRAIDRARFEIFVFAYTQRGKYWHDSIPSDVIVLSEIPEYKITREYSKEAVKYALMTGHWWLGIKRILYPILMRLGFDFGKWNLVFNARKIPGVYDVVVGFVTGTLFSVIQNKVSANKHVMWLHNDFRHEWNEWRFAKFENLDKLVCVSHGMAAKVLETYPNMCGKVCVVHNITDVDKVMRLSRCELTIPRRNGVLRLVTVGRFCPEKQQIIIPKICAVLKERGHSLEWILIGDGKVEMCKVKRLCSDLQVNNMIVFAGGTDNPYPVVKSADLYIQPSANEGWGLSLVEAIALDRPVLASKIPSFCDICAVEDLVEPTYIAFADAIVDRIGKLQRGEKLPIRKSVLEIVSRENVIKEINEALI